MGLGDTFLALASEAGPPGLLPARQQMAVSLGWHIILACFGVAFPTMIFVVHRRGIVRDDPVALGLAKRWAKVSAVLFAIGAVSGTVLSFEMGLLWPGLMGRFGDVLGLPFAFEGLSFFVEAIFLGIYLYGWDRMPPRRHLAMLIPMGVAGIVGTFCVISVNAWMNNPTGFRIVDGAGHRRQPVAGDVQRRGVAAVPAHVGGARSWWSASSSPACTPRACCAAATTRTTGSASRCRSPSPPSPRSPSR